MSVEHDLAAIDEAILRQRVAHLAASARAQQAQVELYDDHTDYRNDRGAVSRDEYVAMLQARGMRRVPAPTAVRRGGWSRRKVGIAVAAVVAGAALVVWCVVGVVNAISAAVSGSGVSAEGLGALAGVVLLLMLLGRGRGGGGTFSGTFTGRMG